MAALLVGVAAYAQNAYDVKETWQKTVNVPTSEAPLIEKLFTAWGAEFPGMYVDAFNKYKETGKAKHIEIYEDAYADFKVECAPKNGYIEISTADTMIATENANFSIGDTIIRRNILTAVYWNLKSGNKLFAVSINDDGEIFPECALAFYDLLHVPKSSRKLWISSTMMRTLSSSFPSKAKTSSFTTSGLGA